MENDIGGSGISIISDVRARCNYCEEYWSQNYDKQPNIRHAFGGPLYWWSCASAAGFLDQEARWLYD